MLTVISALPETARALLSPSNAYVLGIQSACATENRVTVIVYVSNQNRLFRKCLFNSRFLICSGRAAKSHIELISKRCSSFGQLHHSQWASIGIFFLCQTYLIYCNGLLIVITAFHTSLFLFYDTCTNAN